MNDRIEVRIPAALTDAREELNAAVLDAYAQKLEQSDTLDEDEELPFGPSM